MHSSGAGWSQRLGSRACISLDSHCSPTAEKCLATGLRHFSASQIDARRLFVCLPIYLDKAPHVVMDTALVGKGSAVGKRK